MSVSIDIYRHCIGIHNLKWRGPKPVSVSSDHNKSGLNSKLNNSKLIGCLLFYFSVYITTSFLTSLQNQSYKCDQSYNQFWSRRACVRHTWWRMKRSWALFSPTIFLFWPRRLACAMHSLAIVITIVRSFGPGGLRAPCVLACAMHNLAIVITIVQSFFLSSLCTSARCLAHCSVSIQVSYTEKTCLPSKKTSFKVSRCGAHIPPQTRKYYPSEG